MKNFGVIRIAVKLSLIVSTMIQPMVGVCAVAQCADMRCSVVGDSTSICSGCNRCPVSDEGDLCGCCERKPNDNQPADCPHKSLPLNSDETATPEVAASLGICLCGLASSPVDRGQERTPVTEQVEHDECHLSVNCEVPPRPPRLASASLATSLELRLSPRFSQRFLCVWRL